MKNRRPTVVNRARRAPRSPGRRRRRTSAGQGDRLATSASRPRAAAGSWPRSTSPSRRPARRRRGGGRRGLSPSAPSTYERQVVDAEHHVLSRHGDGPARRRREDVVRGEHQHPGLGLGLGREREVHGHLVAVEVGVEGGADERMDLDGLALDQHRLEGLDAEAVERGRPVEKTGCSLMTSSRTSQTSGRRRSTMRLADLMFCAISVSTSRFMTNGLKSSSAISLGRPHWCSFRWGRRR